MNTKFGLNVAAWVNEGLLNYLSPMDSMWTDLNLPFEQFSGVTKDSDCELWPGLLPWSSQRARIRLSAALLSPANCRAYAHSCYENGADGMSLFNVGGVGKCYPYYPQNLYFCHQMGDPDRIAAGERHYIYEPMWVSLTEFEKIKDSTRYNRADHIHLVRDESNAAGEAHLNLYENPDDVFSVQVLFRGSGLSEKDELEVKFNGTIIPDREIGRNRRSDASLDEWGALRISKDGREWACNPEARVDFTQAHASQQGVPAAEPRYSSFSSRWFALNPSILERGRNVLSIKLVEGDPDTSGNIVIDEFEIWVQPR